GFVNETAKAGDAIAKQAAIFGLTGEEFQKVSFAAERTGVSIESIGPALRSITRRAAEAARGNDTYAKAFTELGVQTKDTEGRLKTTGQLIRDVSDQIAGMDQQGQRLSALERIADGGARLVNLFAGGSEALDDYGNQLERIGLISEDQLKMFEEYADAL